MFAVDPHYMYIKIIGPSNFILKKHNIDIVYRS
jgi:hypothetical protein